MRKQRNFRSLDLALATVDLVVYEYFVFEALLRHQDFGCAVNVHRLEIPSSTYYIVFYAQPLIPAAYRLTTPNTSRLGKSAVILWLVPLHSRGLYDRAFGHAIGTIDTTLGVRVNILLRHYMLCEIR